MAGIATVFYVLDFEMFPLYVTADTFLTRNALYLNSESEGRS